MPPSKSRKITDLHDKLHFLLISEEARNIHGYQTINDLAGACGIPPSTLKTLKDKERNTKQRLRPDVEKRLAGICGFDPNWPEWRTASLAAFKEQYLRDAQPAKTMGCARYHDDIPLSPELISARHEQRWAFNDKLASITLFANQEGGGAAQPLALELVCTPAFIEIVELTVKRGELFIDCGDGEASDVSERVAYLEKEGFKRRPQELGITPFGGHVRPGWTLSIESPPASGWHVIGEICEIRKLAAGNTVTACFAAYIKDLEPSRERMSAEQASAACYQSRAFIFKDFSKLSMAKKRVLELMAVVPAADENGYAVLCKDTLRFDVHPSARKLPADE